MPVSKDVVKEQIRKVIVKHGQYHKWFTWKEHRALPRILNEGEEIGYLTAGFDGKGHTLLIVATNLRLMVLDSRFLYGSDDTIFPYSKINSFRPVRGLFFGTLRISTAGVSGDDKVITKIWKNDLTILSSVVSEYMAQVKDR